MAKAPLPPLTTLRGFEAAARHLSFTLAAAEINVTQGAVSRQIRQLEKAMGVTLFRRLTRRVELTREGEEFFQTVRDVFAELEYAGARLRRRSSPRVLTISALPTIASNWLMPRLHQFAATGSKIELHIVSSIEPVSFVDRSADVAIRVGRLPGRSYAPGAPRIELEMVTNWVDVTAEELFPDRLVPVCSPHLFARRRAPARHGDLLDFPLIHTATRRHAWPDWLRAHGVKDGRAEGNLEFGHFFMALEAARRVQGVALVPQIVLTHYPAAHELTAPFPPDVASAGEYYLLTPQSRRGDAPIEAFRAWIMVEARLTATHLLPSSYRPGPLSVTAAGGQRRSHG